jgi:hypothetical protein
VPPARVVHEDAPHHLRGDAEEVGAVLPLHAALVHQAQVGLVHERRRLERVLRGLAAHRPRRAPPQLGVHLGQQPVASCLIAGPPGDEELGDVRARRGRRRLS